MMALNVPTYINLYGYGYHKPYYGYSYYKPYYHHYKGY